MTTHNQSKPMNSARVNWWVDLGLLAGIMLALAPQVTGLAIHEWLSLSLGAAAVAHLLLHWNWTVATLRRFFGHLAGAVRFNLLLNIALFIDLTIVIFTGLLISRVALPSLGISLSGDRAWASLHFQAADASLYLMGLHVAVHWKWIVNAFGRFVVNPIRRALTPAVQPAAPLTPARSEVK